MRDLIIGVCACLIIALAGVAYDHDKFISSLRSQNIELQQNLRDLEKQVLENTYKDCFDKCRLDFFYIPFIANSRTEIEKLDECMKICLERG